MPNNSATKKKIASKVIIPAGRKFSKTTQTIPAPEEKPKILPPSPIHTHANGDSVAAALDQAAANNEKKNDGYEDLTPSHSPSPNVSPTPPLELNEYFEALNDDKSNKKEENEHNNESTNKNNEHQNDDNVGDGAPIPFRQFMQNPINAPRRAASNNRANSYARGGSYYRGNNPRFHHHSYHPIAHCFPHHLPNHQHHRHRFVPARHYTPMTYRGDWRGRGAAFTRGSAFPTRGCSCARGHHHHYY